MRYQQHPSHDEGRAYGKVWLLDSLCSTDTAAAAIGWNVGTMTRGTSPSGSEGTDHREGVFSDTDVKIDGDTPGDGEGTNSD